MILNHKHVNLILVSQIIWQIEQLTGSPELSRQNLPWQHRHHPWWRYFHLHEYYATSQIKESLLTSEMHQMFTLAEIFCSSATLQWISSGVQIILELLNCGRNWPGAVLTSAQIARDWRQLNVDTRHLLSYPRPHLTLASDWSKGSILSSHWPGKTRPHTSLAEVLRG